MTKKQYLPYLDYAKVIGIFLVVYDHVMGYSATPDAIAMYNKSFLMPMFFLISGMLYRPLSLKETLRKDWHTLIVPYLLLNAICWLPQLAIYLIKGTFTFSNIYSNLGAIVLGLGYNAGGFSPVSSPCWFIYVLFLARVLISLLPQKNNGYMLGLTALSILATMALQYYCIDLYVPFDSAFLALPFVCVGYVLREQIKGDIARRGVYNLLSILVLAAVWFYSVGYNGWVDTNSCVVGRSLFVYYLSGFFGAVLLLKIANCLKDAPEKLSGGAKSLSKCLLVIVGLNIWLITISAMCLKRIIHVSLYNGIPAFLLAVFVFLLFIPICMFCKKHLPIIIGNRK